MINKKLNDLTESDLQSLISNAVPEGRNIEYKQTLPGNSNGDKIEFLADVSSFANTSGGDTIYGLEEAQGVPIRIVPLQISDLDLDVRRLDSIIADGLRPRIRHSIRPVPLGGGGHAVVIRVERSRTGPHRVVFNKHDRFYARNSAGKYSLDLDELRDAFTASAGLAEKLKDFRVNRILSILNNDLPLPFVDGPRVIMHVIPFQSLGSGERFDVLQYDKYPLDVPLLTNTVRDRQINFEGFVVWAGPETPHSYTQLFRNGVIESVSGTLLRSGNQGIQYIPHIHLEQRVIQHANDCFNVLKRLGVSPPVAVALTLTGAKGFRIRPGDWSTESGVAIRQENLILLEAVFEDFEQSLTRTLKPSFDLIWNACGFAGSVNFDADANWLQSGYPLQI